MVRLRLRIISRCFSFLLQQTISAIIIRHTPVIVIDKCPPHSRALFLVCGVGGVANVPHGSKQAQTGRQEKEEQPIEAPGNRRGVAASSTRAFPFPRLASLATIYCVVVQTAIRKKNDCFVMNVAPAHRQDRARCPSSQRGASVALDVTVRTSLNLYKGVVTCRKTCQFPFLIFSTRLVLVSLQYTVVGGMIVGAGYLCWMYVQYVQYAGERMDMMGWMDRLAKFGFDRVVARGGQVSLAKALIAVV